MRHPTAPILVLTRIWPTRERPSLGAFVRDRVRGLPDVRVVRPRSQRLPWPILYAVLFVDAVRAGRVRGVEAHMAVPTGLVGLVVARLRGVPLVVYSHGGDVRGWRRFRAPVRWLTRFVLRHAARVVTNSEDTARFIREMGVEPVVAPPGVDLERFAVWPRPKARRVLYLGGTTRRKGYDVASRLADTLVGPGILEVQPDEVPRLLAEHDVVLVPSRAEPFGLVAVEAIAAGRWVVAADVGGLRDIVQDGVNGTLVSDGDYAGAIARVPEYDPEALPATVARFSLDVWHRAMAGVWDEVLRSS
jgi:glycosyltransferase involved in cell wall biosynthesis